jgi:hypothetical protein
MPKAIFQPESPPAKPFTDSRDSFKGMARCAVTVLISRFPIPEDGILKTALFDRIFG